MNRRLRACTITALSIMGLLFGAGYSGLSPVSSARADGPNMTGTYLADQGGGNFYGMYYVQQVGSTVYWTGLSMDPNLALDQLFHRGVDFTNVFQGVVSYNTGLGAWVVSGDWVDMSRGTTLGSGTVTLQIDTASDGSVAGLERQAETGGFNATHWTPTSFSDAPDMYERFTEVEKGADPGSLSANGLKPYRDQTVFYGRVIDDRLGNTTTPKYPFFVDPPVSRDYTNFICDSNDDHDLEVNIAVNRSPFDNISSTFDTNFQGAGWSDRNPQDVLQKLYDSTANQALENELAKVGLPTNPDESFIHAEGLMYGHTADCDQAKAGDTGRVLFPGWADRGGNSILINGQPINGADSYSNIEQAQDSVRFGSHTPLLLFDQVRITGALMLDCGHGTGSCHEGDSYSDNNDAQNQEIHPIYSIDIISHNPSHTSLTGAWGSEDGGTFYIRQIGNTIWWLGLSRDREALVPPGASPPIPTYATVFKGAITDNPDGSATISGDGATVPYAGAAGGDGYTTSFTVSIDRTTITTYSTTGNPIFDHGFQFHKLYEPDDTTPPQSTLQIGTPKYPPGSSQPFVTSSTPLTVNASDAGSGVQNVWYRFFPQGTTPPAYTPVVGSPASFTLSGPDGLYEVDTYATDNAGNDEAPHTQLVYLDNTPPQTTINQPAATTYTHSQTLTLNYTVDDGTGSGVQSVTPTMDNAATVGGLGLQSGQAISLLTLPLGTHTFTVNAQDHVGNASTHSVAFTIIVTAQSILGDVNQFVASGALTQDGGTSLLAKLNSAANARTAGDCTTAAGVYQAFINEVQAQSGKKITALAASTLIADARYLIAHCP